MHLQGARVTCPQSSPTRAPAVKSEWSSASASTSPQVYRCIVKAHPHFSLSLSLTHTHTHTLSPALSLTTHTHTYKHILSANKPFPKSWLIAFCPSCAVSMHMSEGSLHAIMQQQSTFVVPQAAAGPLQYDTLYHGSGQPPCLYAFLGRPAYTHGQNKSDIRIGRTISMARHREDRGMATTISISNCN